ncbi:MAG TPA: hypothetical protein VLA66_06155 [Thermoanaerobaculia bacterium]|nr:hypothetical protein [Thermoanaerobaculia bacterium]
MSRRALVVAWLSVGLAGATAPSAGQPGDPRSIVLLREDCVSSIGHREVTLFANGTVRVVEGSPDAESMHLGEATRDEVGAFLRRLAEPDLSETDPREESPVGAWVESCTLDLLLPDRPAQRFRYGRYASHSLALRAVLTVVRDIEALAEPESAVSDLPLDYEPRTGDLLERTDGIRFEIVGKTADGKGVELSSPEQPLTLYVPISDLRGLFVRLVSRRQIGP